MFDAKQRRINEYTNWTGAKLVDNYGNLVEPTPSSPEKDLKTAESELKLIRVMLGSGIDYCECNINKRSIVDYIRRLLTPEELTRVSFTFFDPPRPGNLRAKN